MNSVLFSIVFAFLATLCEVESDPQYDAYEESAVDRESQYYCNQLKSCTPGGGKVCGFDQYKPWLAEFEDICTLYKVNCRHMGRFHPVEQVVCDTRIKYDKEHQNETFEVIHIRSTTTYNPALRTTEAVTLKQPPVKLYYALFAAYHCLQRQHCTPGGGWVCGINNAIHAKFPDKCHFHGANCLRQGVYRQVTTETCDPQIKFLEAHTVYKNQHIFEYSTEYIKYPKQPIYEFSPSTIRTPRKTTTKTIQTHLEGDDNTYEGLVKRIKYQKQPIYEYSTERIVTQPSSMRRQKQAELATEKSSIFTKIKDAIGISVNFSIHN